MDRALFNAMVSRKLAGPGHALPAGDNRLGYADPAAAVCEVDERAMRVRAVISTIDRDRSGDVVLPQGCLRTLDSYRRNPVVLLGHQELHPLPVGRSEDSAGRPGVDVEPDHRVLAWCRFSQATQDACDVFRLVAEGTLKQASIGFIPHVASRLSGTPHGKARIEGGKDRDGFYVEDWELVEWSWVVIADNQSCEAIRAHLSRGKITGKSISPVMRKALRAYAAPAKVWSNGMATEVVTKAADDEEVEDVATEEETTPEEEVETKAEEAAPEEVEAETEAPAEEDATEEQVPLSAQVSREVIEHVRSLASYFDEVESLIEQPKILAHVQKYRGKLDEIISDWHALASEIHPDHDFGESPSSGEEEETEEVEEKEADDEEVETEEEDNYETKGEDAEDSEIEEEEEDDEDPTDRYKGRPAPVSKGRRRMHGTHRSVCKDAAEYLEEASDHGDMHKFFRHGLKYHAGALRKAMDDAIAEAVEEETGEMGDTERKALQGQLQKLARQLRMTFGKKVVV